MIRTCLLALACAACTTDRPREHFQPRATGLGGQMSPEEMPDAGGEADAGSADAAASDGGDLADLFQTCEAPAGEAAFSREVLRSAAAACVGYHLCGFHAAAEDLNEAVAAYRDGPGAPTLAAAQEAYRRAVGIWSRVESMRFGPLSNSADDMVHGQNLRAQVHAWPTVARCRIEQAVIERPDLDDNGFDTVPVSAQGLFALDYLLFYAGDETDCASASATAEAWAMRSAEDLSREKRRYAAAVSGRLVELAQVLVEAYSPDGSFVPDFVTGSAYGSGQEALNVLASALLYVDREVKDWKLGVPAGLTATAPVTTGESPFAGVSGRAVVQNLEGFQRMFAGCGDDGSGLGFDDWLREAGHSELADDLERAHAGAVAAARALPGDLAVASQAELATAYEALRELTTLLKAELFGSGSPLNLRLPATVEGDTD